MFKKGDILVFKEANKACRIGATCKVLAVSANGESVNVEITECPLDSREVGRKLGVSTFKLTYPIYNNKDAKRVLKAR